MTSYVLRKIGLLKNKKFLKALSLAGVELEGHTIVTNQPLNLRKWVRKWRRELLKTT